jgi:hypothetical protein
VLALPFMFIWNFIAGILHFVVIDYWFSLLGVFIFDLINNLIIDPIWKYFKYKE